MTSSRWVHACIAALAIACGNAEPPASAAAPAPSTTVAPTTVAPAPVSAVPAPVTGIPPASATARAWPQPPSVADVGGGCTAAAPISISATGSSIALAATPSGALLAVLDHEHVTLQPIDPSGAALGAATGIDIPRMTALIGLERLDEGLVLVALTGCADGGWRHGCIVATPIDDHGTALDAAATAEVPSATFSAQAAGWTVPSRAGGAVWVIGEFATSHSGSGFRALRVGHDTSGALVLGELRSFGESMGEGAEIVGLRTDANDDDLVLLLGARGYGASDAPHSVRYLGRYASETTVEVGDLGSVVHDLVLGAGTAQVLFDRGADYFTASIDAAGHVVGATPLDRAQTFPAPFGQRVLAEWAGSAGQEQRVLHDASGRRLGGPLPRGAIVWTGGTSAIIASSTAAAGITVTPLTCVRPELVPPR